MVPTAIATFGHDHDPGITGYHNANCACADYRIAGMRLICWGIGSVSESEIATAIALKMSIYY